MDPKIVDLYNEYIHGDMPRRRFLERVAQIAGGMAAATSALLLLEPNYAGGTQIDPEDSQLTLESVEYDGVEGPVRGYLAKPSETTDPLPGVLVIHENRGLNAHIEDVARRIALEGYVALAPDGLSYVGGAPADQEKARNLFGESDRERITADVMAGLSYLDERDDCTGRIGTVGFCYGGGVSLRCATLGDPVAASVCFYGSALTKKQVGKVRIPIMMHYAGNDERINQMIPEFRSALDQKQVAYSLHMYPGTGHGFHNDTSEARYDREAAELAWSRTVRFFRDFL